MHGVAALADSCDVDDSSGEYRTGLGERVGEKELKIYTMHKRTISCGILITNIAPHVAYREQMHRHT